MLGVTFRTLVGFDPSARPCALPQTAQEAHRPVLGIRAVVSSHHGFDSLGGLVGIVEWDGADEMMQDVSFNDAVEEMTPNESKLTVDGCGGTTGKIPDFRIIVGQRWVCMLQECDSNYHTISKHRGQNVV